jgi:hypothetical protein
VCVRREALDAAVIDAARVVDGLLRAMEEAARPFSLAELGVDPVALLNRRDLNYGLRAICSDAVEYVRAANAAMTTDQHASAQ